MNSAVKAKVFKDGRSQAVRIPAPYRFKTDHVYVEQDGQKGSLTFSEEPIAGRKERIRKLFEEINAAGGLEFELDRDLRPEAEREEW